MEGDRIKKLALALCLIVTVGMFAGCSTTTAKTQDSPFAIYNEYENIRVDIGNKRADVEKLLGVDLKMDTTFEEENIQRLEYWDHENVSVDFDMETELVIGMRFSDTQWSIYNGLKVGDSIDAVVKQYPEGTVRKSPTSEDLWVAYDKERNVISYNEDAPYLVRFKITDGKVATIILMDNEAYPQY